MATVASTTIIQHCALIEKAGDGQDCVVGEGNVIEDFVVIKNSRVGDRNLFEVKSYINECVIGSNCKISVRVKLHRCTVGNNCSIAAGIELTDITIPDKVSIFMTEDGWKMREGPNYNATEQAVSDLLKHFEAKK